MSTNKEPANDFSGISEADLTCAPMTGGIAHRSVAHREELAQLERKKKSLLADPPISVLRDAPVFVFNEMFPGWESAAVKAVHHGQVIQGKLRNHPSVAILITETSWKLHQKLADEALATLNQLLAAQPL